MMQAQKTPAKLKHYTLAALCLACAALAPQAVRALPDFYWEEPIRLSRGQGAYPQAFRSGQNVLA
ncbi:MAG TPA: hypothetical protein PLC54_01455, partial [Spirochaetales bacterium]|nr:hypothetical protein [Spirochaetales bacterium]